jgi:MarR-like DNA-binding transcriptional regulator SgrR of sgrS sRNA
LYNRLILTFANVGIDMARNKGRKVAKRPIQRRLTLLERGIAAGLAIGGSNQYEIAKELNCTTKTVRELLKKVEETKKLEDRPRPGNQRRHLIVKIVLSNFLQSKIEDSLPKQ